MSINSQSIGFNETLMSNPARTREPTLAKRRPSAETLGAFWRVWGASRDSRRWMQGLNKIAKRERKYGNGS